MQDPDSTPLVFSQLGLAPAVLTALDEVGYETPTPIQAQCIPVLIEGRDLIGQAQTGTGKTAAFALPILSQIDIADGRPQALVLTPTRELAIQVAEAFQRYASHLPGFHVLPVYGGQGYAVQLRALSRGVHVVVGTPGRIMDHMRRGTLRLGALRTLVLDEADEMLRMGFIDDVLWVLEQIPSTHQTALFSATVPNPIRAIAERFLNSPAEVSIRMETTSAATIRQRYWPVSGMHKLDALTRILEVEETDGVLIFVRTKIATVELAEKLEARGFSSGAINGDMLQPARERTIEQLKQGRLDILVATDVAARGLDVDRLSHVVNYDIPHDPEAYVHRIGRTGRAGRHGEAILFVAAREARMLRVIESVSGGRIARMALPSVEAVNDTRRARFMAKLDEARGEARAKGEFDPYVDLITQYCREREVDATEVAAVLARALQGDSPLFLDGNERTRSRPARESPSRARSRS